MIPQNDTKSLTVRLPLALYEAGGALAQRRRTSMNALLQEGLVNLIRESEQKALYDAFTLVGDDEETDLSFAEAAQAEVICRNE